MTFFRGWHSLHSSKWNFTQCFPFSTKHRKDCVENVLKLKKESSQYDRYQNMTISFFLCKLVTFVQAYRQATSGPSCQLGHFCKFLGHSTLEAGYYTYNTTENVLFMAEISKSLASCILVAWKCNSLRNFDILIPHTLVYILPRKYGLKCLKFPPQTRNLHRKLIN